MHANPRVAIDTTAPSCEWIDMLLDDIQRFGGDTQDIAWFCRMLKENNCRAESVISQRYDSLRQGAELVILPVVHPRHYKWYLGFLDEAAEHLRTDPRCIVVFDHEGLMESSADKHVIATRMSVEVLLNRWRKRYGCDRILTRAQAIVRVLHLQARNMVAA